MLHTKRPILRQALGQTQAEYVGLPTMFLLFGNLFLRQAPAGWSSDFTQLQDSQSGVNEHALHWNQPQTQTSPLHSQMEEARLESRDDPMIMDFPGPSQSDTDPGLQKTTYNAPEAPTIFASDLTGVAQSRGSMRSTVRKSRSPNAASGGFPTFEQKVAPIPQESPDNHRVLSSEDSNRSEKEEFQDIFSELMTGTEHEIAFLTRHYSEVIGPWYVPIPSS